VRHPCLTHDWLDLGGLAARIGKSSNFRFAWQFYVFEAIAPRSSHGIREALNLMIASPELHAFLRNSFENSVYQEAFWIEPLHEHCRIEDAPDFENTLAAAAADRLGAYSRDLRPATEKESAEIAAMFGSVGDYRAYQLLPGNVTGCADCHAFNYHLFTSWFYGVAWDWCFLVTWPKQKLLWLGCLTDTD